MSNTTKIFLAVAAVLACCVCLAAAGFFLLAGSFDDPLIEAADSDLPAVPSNEPFESLVLGYMTAMVNDNCDEAAHYLRPGAQQDVAYCDNSEWFPVSSYTVEAVSVRNCGPQDSSAAFPCTAQHKIVRLQGTIVEEYGNTYDWYEIQVINVNGTWYVDKEWDAGYGE